MSSLIKKSAYYTIGNITTKAVNFLLLPLYTKYLTPDEYGIVNSMQVFSSIILVFFTFGLEGALFRLYHDYKTTLERKIFLGTITISIAVISLISSGVMFLFYRPIGQIFKSIAFFPYYSYAILTSLFLTYEFVPKISLQVKEKAKSYLILSLVLLFIRIIPIIWEVVFQKSGAIGMLKGTMIGNALCIFVLLPYILSQINLNFKFSILEKTLKYCLPFVPLIISSWIVNMSDRIFIERYFSTYEVGIYSLGYKLGQVVKLLSASILMAYNPFFYKMANSENQKNAKQTLYKVNNICILFMLCIGFLVALFSKDIITLLFDEKYYETYKIIPIIVLGYFFIQMISLQNLSFYQEKKTVEIMLINIFGAIFNIGTNFIFISRYGYLGAAISTFLTQFVLFLIIYNSSKKYYFIPYNWKLLLPTTLLFISICLFTILLLPVNTYLIIVKILVLFIGLTIFYKKIKLHFINVILKF